LPPDAFVFGGVCVLEFLEGSEVSVDPVVDEAGEEWNGDGGVEVTDAMEEPDLIEEMAGSGDVLPIVARKRRAELREALRLIGGGVGGEEAIGFDARLHDVRIVEPTVELQGGLADSWASVTRCWR
jgi:hypothetical protein